LISIEINTTAMTDKIAPMAAGLPASIEPQPRSLGARKPRLGLVSGGYCT
jgi:hypothetical protein